MSQVIVEIGYQRMVLPSDAYLPGLLKALKGAVEIRYGGECDTWELGDEVVVETKTVTRKTKFTTKAGELVDLTRAKKAKASVIVPMPVREELEYQRQLRLEGGAR